MRRAALFIALALTLAACGGSDESVDTSIPEVPDGEVTTTEARPPGEPGTAQSGNLVSVDYTGRLEDGTEFDTSIGKQPIQFTIDAGEMIQGFNDAVVGMAVGESKTVTLPKDQAYQDYDPNLVIEVPLEQLPEGVAAGDKLMSPIGAVVRVLEVGEESATIDQNHELAGQTLIFEITLVSIDG